MKRLNLILFLILFLIPAADIYAAQAIVSVDREDLSLNETFVIKVSLKGASGKVFLPETQGLKVLSTGQSSNVRMMNGRVEEEVVFSYSILPYKSGKITIPSFKVKTSKGILKTNEITLNIKEKSSASIPGKEAIFAKAAFTDSSPYISEKIKYKIIVYSDESVARIGFEEPKFDNFIAERKKDNTYTKIVAGKAYGVTEIVYDLVPVKAGKGKIGAAKIEAEIRYRNNRSNRSGDPFYNDPFFSSSYSSKRKILLTNPVEYEVRKLPETSLTSFFTNIVGKIEGYSKTDKTSVSSDDFLNYKIIINGYGNLSELKLPDLNFSKNYKVYKDEPQTKLREGDRGKQGRVVSGYAIVPSSTGKFSIPGFKLRYFDTGDEKWKEIEIEKQDFSVSDEGKIPPGPGEDKGEKPYKKEKKNKIDKLPDNIVKKEKDIIFVKAEKETLFSARPDYRMFFVSTSSLFILFIFSLFVKNLFSELIDNFKKRKSDIEKRFDSALEIQDQKEAAGFIKSLIIEFIQEKYEKDFSSYLLSIDENIRKEINIHISYLEKIQFSQESVGINIEEIINKTKELIKRL